MKDLIEALQIFAKYRNEKWPTNCSHDFLAIMDIGYDEVSSAHRQQLDELGFFWSEEFDCWGSFRFGST